VSYLGRKDRRDRGQRRIDCYQQVDDSEGSGGEAGDQHEDMPLAGIGGREFANVVSL
jgi:hypothetical protein